MSAVECRACAAGLSLIWHVQSKKYMHEEPGLSVTSCERRDAKERVEADQRELWRQFAASCGNCGRVRVDAPTGQSELWLCPRCADGDPPCAGDLANDQHGEKR